MKIKFFFVTFYLVFLATIAICQNKAENYIIYSDKSTIIEIHYDLSNEACENTGRPNYISYTLNGTKQNKKAFVAFKFGYLDCAGNLKYQQYSIDISQNGPSKIGIRCENIDWSFEGTLDDPFFDVELTSFNKQSSGVTIHPFSTEPENIEGNTYIFYNDPLELEVKGGRLGEGASWVWYENSCEGKPIGYGKNLNVYPKYNTIYYVRAEGKNNITNCAKLSVTVDRSSVKATSIIGNAKICFGNETTLTVFGGILGPEANWVWYEGDCGSKSIGQGSTIKIRPSVSQFYYVRAEGPVNITSCISLKINVINSSKEPDSIFSLTDLSICEGEIINLEIAGGVLATDAIWNWYDNTKFQSPIGAGTNVTITPTSNTTYYVRAEGMCNNTIAKSIKVIVNQKSINPSYISSSKTKILKGDKVTLSVSNGTLGKDAHWEWYKKTKKGVTKIGQGPEIKIKDRKPKYYYVKAIGLCNETEYLPFYSNPQKAHYFDTKYSEKPNKFLSLGLGLGAEVVSNFGPYEFITTDTDGFVINTSTSNLTVNYIGLKGEINFYPVIKEYLSLGLISNYSLGISPLDIATGGIHKNGLVTKESILFTNFNITTELCSGFKKTKFLIILNRSFQHLDFIRTVSTNNTGEIDTYILKTNSNFETLSFGVRLGKYNKGFVYKKGNNVDLTYNLKRKYILNPGQFNFNDYTNLGNWTVGAGIQWWQHSSFKIRFEISLNQNQNILNFKTLSMNNSILQLSFIYNINWFY